eukprot:3461937-Pyramimonas_sp.AAC.1
MVTRSADVRSRAFLGNTRGLTSVGFSCSASSSTKFVVKAAFADEVNLTGDEYVVVVSMLKSNFVYLDMLHALCKSPTLGS